MSIRRIKPAELARELGVSRQAIQDLIGRNIISKDAEGLIDADMAKVAIANRVRPSGKAAAAVLAPAPPPAGIQPPVAPPAEQHIDPAAATSFHVARTLREAEEATMARMKRMQMEAKLIESEPAVQATYTAFRTLRDTAMPMGRRVAAKVAAMTDPREIQLLIEAELREVFQRFAEHTLQTLAGKLATNPAAMADTAPQAAEK